MVALFECHTPFIVCEIFYVGFLYSIEFVRHVVFVCLSRWPLKENGNYYCWQIDRSRLFARLIVII